MNKIKKKNRGRNFPNRIVCLSADSADILFRLGEGHRIVGISSYTTAPGRFGNIARISGFSTADRDRIVLLKPDLVIAYSYVQSSMVTDLVKAGLSVLTTQQISLQGIEEMMLLLGRIVQREEKAHHLVDAFRSRIRRSSSKFRPRVYFEEWPKGRKPGTMITGIGWISELIERAGGEDVFSEFRKCNIAWDREVSTNEIVQRNPEIVLASWCGRPVSLDSFFRRPGWETIEAIRSGNVFEIQADILLQPSYVVTKGYRKLCRIIQAHPVP